MPNNEQYQAGAAQVDLTPTRPMFLYGYPHVARDSTGVNDPLLASALYLRGADGGEVVFVACDLCWLSKDTVTRCRQRIARDAGSDASRVVITATHTHSGPVTATLISNADDTVVPPVDERYLHQVEDAIVRAAVEAKRSARAAALRFAVADGSALGTNRRDPSGPALPQVPVLWCRDAATDEPIAVMAVCTMHPTVLHEDSTLISGDFPGLARRYLQQHVVGEACPFVYHMGAAGNQSPRHVTKANTIAEAERLGEALARAIADTADRAEPVADSTIAVRSKQVDLPLRELPTVADASAAYDRAVDRLESLRKSGAPRTEVRTAECDWFGAQETLTLAKAAAGTALREFADRCSPAEVTAVRLGPHVFVGWPGEVFVEFALQVREAFPHAWIITLANGDLQGYLVTQQAVDEKAYESGNAIFASPESPERLVRATYDLLEGW